MSASNFNRMSVLLSLIVTLATGCERESSNSATVANLEVDIGSRRVVLPRESDGVSGPFGGGVNPLRPVPLRPGEVGSAPEGDQTVVLDTPQELLSKRAQAKIKAVWFAGGIGPTAKGGTSEVTIRVEPNESGEPAVGVIEERIDGGGNQWEAAAWIAAFNATSRVGVPLGAYEFQIRTPGKIDGPSAGMLTTATMLALLKGDPIRPDTTMTGAVNPDGTAWPVGGIPQKMEGAKAAGLTRFGYPIGCRNTMDYRTKANVDLQTVAQKLGLEARELKDIDEAYEFLTGRRLDESVEADESELELSEDHVATMQAHIASWEAEMSALVPQIRSRIAMLDAGNAQYVQTMLAGFQKDSATADRYQDSGMWVPAYVFRIRSAVQLGIVDQVLEFVEHYARSDYRRIADQLSRLEAVAAKNDALLSELRVRSRKKTVGGQINAMRGFEGVALAAALSREGGKTVAPAKEILQGILDGTYDPYQEEVINAVSTTSVLPMIYYGAAEAVMKTARQQVELAAEEGGATAVSLDSLALLARGYGSAAGASLEYFDSLITDELSKDQGLSRAGAQARVAEIEPDYPTIFNSVELAQNIGSQESDLALFRLSAGASAYIQAGGLVNKHYSLMATQDAEGRVTLSNRRALSSQLDHARRRARQAAARCRDQLGFIPAAARMDYAFAIAEREGDDEAKLGALESYWMATHLCDLAVALAKK